MKEFTVDLAQVIHLGPAVMLSGKTRVVESSHRGMPPNGFSHMVENLYVGSDLFTRMKTAFNG